MKFQTPTRFETLELQLSNALLVAGVNRPDEDHNAAPLVYAAISAPDDLEVLGDDCSVHTYAAVELVLRVLAATHDKPAHDAIDEIRAAIRETWAMVEEYRADCRSVTPL